MKARPVSICIAFDGRITKGRRVQYTAIVDSDGNVHERASDMPPGFWATWPAELLPERVRAHVRRRRKKQF